MVLLLLLLDAGLTRLTEALLLSFESFVGIIFKLRSLGRFFMLIIFEFFIIFMIELSLVSFLLRVKFNAFLRQ